MGLSHLPLPLFLVICTTGSIFLIYIAIKRRNIDRNGLVVLYVTIAIETILSAVIRILKETTNIYINYFDNTGYILLSYVFIILAELLYLSLTHKGNVKTKKIILLGWGFILVPLLLAAIIYVLVD